MYQDIYNCICQNTQKNKIHYPLSNLQPNCSLKFDFQKVDQHAGGKWLIHDTKRRKENQLFHWNYISPINAYSCFVLAHACSMVGPMTWMM